jgi:hypothetical protein
MIPKKDFKARVMDTTYGRVKSARGWWKVIFDINLQYEGEHERFGEGVRFNYLSEASREHILNCIKEGFTQGELIEEYEEPETEENPFKCREDERSCHCNNCCARFREGEIICKGDEEHCPICGMPGFIEDDPSCCSDCPRKKCEETPANCKSPCPACPLESDCYNENTDKRHECRVFIKFQEEAGCE